MNRKKSPLLSIVSINCILWRSDVENIDSLEDLGGSAECLDLDSLHFMISASALDLREAAIHKQFRTWAVAAVVDARSARVFKAGRCRLEPVMSAFCPPCFISCN
jgi:hypothetical protein